MKRGFFMLEFLIYSMLFTVIVYLVMQTIASRTIALNRERDRFNQVLHYYAALDALSHYGLQAPIDKKYYYATDTSRLIWHDRAGQKDKGFMIEDHKVYWCQGIFNKTALQWQSVRKWLLADNVTHASFIPSWKTYKKNDFLGSVRCVLKAHGKEYLRIMSSAEKVIL